MTDRRHCVVIAVNCKPAGELPRLRRTAEELAKLLLDPELGGCVPGLPDGDYLLDGDQSAAAVSECIDKAISHAGRSGATLVLAMLGHGFALADELYYMASNSTAGQMVHAVNVPHAFAMAADYPGVKGVFGIVDTCMAAAAIPGNVVGGARAGQTVLHLLMAAGRTEDAYRLQASQSLTEVLRTGLPVAEEYLTVVHVCDELRQRIGEQTVTSYSYDGALWAGPLWLSRNRGFSERPISDGLMGAEGQRQMETARREVAGLAAMENVTWQELRRAAGSGSGVSRRAARIVDTLAATRRTVEFIRRKLMQAGPSKRRSDEVFARALRALERNGMPAAVAAPLDGLRSEVDFVEHVAFQRTAVDGDYRAPLAWFVAALAAELGAASDERLLREWASELNATFAMDVALRAVRVVQVRQRLRLVLLFPSLSGPWPANVDASLHEDGQPPARLIIPCGAHGGLSELDVGLRRAIDWARAEADDRNHQLWHIDIVAPARILMKWRPEEVKDHVVLGAEFEFAFHWIDRTYPRSLSMNQAAVSCLDEMAFMTSGEIMVWLTADEQDDAAQVHGRLINRQHRGALGLHRHPAENVELFELLLRHAPIVVWPHEDPIDKAIRSEVETCWVDLPEEFARAFRRQTQTQTPEPLAAVRAVWEDREWLERCKVFQRM
jgi:hypothetical protein